MVGVVEDKSGSVYLTRLQKTVLLWDYYAIEAKLQESAGSGKKKRKRESGDDDAGTDKGVSTEKVNDETKDGNKQENEEEEEEEEEVVEEEEEKAEQKQEEVMEDSKLRDVPLRFSDINDYLSVFEPLLLEECKVQIFRGEEDTTWAQQCHPAVVSQFERVNEFYFIRVTVEVGVVDIMHENDLVLLSREKPIGSEKKSVTYMLANVESHEGKQILRLRLYLGDDLEGDKMGLIKSSQMRINRIRKAISKVKSPFWMVKLCNLSTISREYKALHSVHALPFFESIISAKDLSANSKIGSGGVVKWNIPVPLMGCLEENHNSSQFQAIQQGLCRAPIVLIQGPPGTGKTQTILGLLSVVLHATPVHQTSDRSGRNLVRRTEITFKNKLKHWYQAAPWLGTGANPRDLIMPEDGDEGFGVSGSDAFVAESVGSKRRHRQHVLVCAPSNAALDEIVLRLLNTGVRDESGGYYNPSVVRVGLNAHHSIQAVSMDHLVSQRLSAMERSMSGAAKSNVGVERDRIRISILDEAAIVCSTLSYSGAGIFSRMTRGFDVVVIDEAAQAVEPSTLVPLCHGCRQVFMVGDPIQLPATVLSTTAVQFGYGMSMFKRLQMGGYPVQMLKTQYRMHPLIREFPSAEFYDKALEDGEQVKDQTQRPWHEYRCFGPFAFFDIDGKEEQPQSAGSYVNEEEAEFVLVLFRHMLARYPQLKEGPLMAIISPYKYQVKLLRAKIAETLGEDVRKLVDINTIDGFQGREKDVAIFSCVRSHKYKGIGFVSDFRRMNVGLTRARASMLVVGCAAALKKDEHWGNLIAYARRKKRLFKVTRPYHALFKEESLSEMKKMDEQEQDDDNVAGKPAPNKGMAVKVEMKKTESGEKAMEKKSEDKDAIDDDDDEDMDDDDEDYYGGGDEEEEEDALANLGSFDDDD